MRGRTVLALVAALCVSVSEIAAQVPEATGDPAPAESLAELRAELEAARKAHEDATREITRQQEELEERIEELEKAKTAQEDATRSIIAQAISESGSNINAFVVFGGTFELVGGWAEDFEGPPQRAFQLNTVEADFEIQVNDWTLGSVILEYDDGQDTFFRTTEGKEASVDRINVDTAFVTFGDTQRFFPFTSFGRMIVPFGISTGDPVADVLTLEDPLTVEVFEMKQDAIQIGFEFPTPPVRPAPPMTAPPRVRPKFLGPLMGKLSRALGYRPLPAPARPPVFVSPTRVPPFSAAIYAFNGVTFDRVPERGWSPHEHFGATVGYRTKGIEIDVDWNSSVFDSRFLRFEYADFLGQIGFVPGMAASAKSNLGPFAVVGEWNAAIDNATFVDDAGASIKMRPRAWQVSLGYQANWNRWVEAIGAQGTYLALGYSESRDLAGVTRVIDGEESRVGSVPKRRFVVSFGEWVWEGTRLAVEYSHIVDYERSEGGTGKGADAVFSMLTYEW